MMLDKINEMLESIDEALGLDIDELTKVFLYSKQDVLRSVKTNMIGIESAATDQLKKLLESRLAGQKDAFKFIMEM